MAVKSANPKLGVFEENRGTGVWSIRYKDENGEIQEREVGSKEDAHEAYVDVREDTKAERNLIDYLSNLEHQQAKKEGRVSGRELRAAMMTIAKYIVASRPPEEGHKVAAVCAKLDQLVADSSVILLG